MSYHANFVQVFPSNFDDVMDYISDFTYEEMCILFNEREQQMAVHIKNQKDYCFIFDKRMYDRAIIVNQNIML